MDAENRDFTVTDLGSLLRAGAGERQLWVTCPQLQAIWNMMRLCANLPAGAGLLTLARADGDEEGLAEAGDAAERSIRAAGYPGAFCRLSGNELLALMPGSEELCRMYVSLRAELGDGWARRGVTANTASVELLSEGAPEAPAEGGAAQRLWPKLRDWISFISAVRGSYETVAAADLTENSFRLTQAAPERADEFAACADYDALLLEMAQDVLPDEREEYLRRFGRRNLLQLLRAGRKSCSMEHLQRCSGGALLPAVTRAVFPNSREPGESSVLLYVRTADRESENG